MALRYNVLRRAPPTVRAPLPRDGLRLGDRELFGVIDNLNPMPGHRVRLINFFHNESRRTQR